MRSLVYYVAVTLDGFIAREDGSFSDFPWDDTFIAALMERFPETMPAPMRPGATRDGNRVFDTVLMGRRTYQVGVEQGLTSPYPTLDQYVVSTTLGPSPDPAVTVVDADIGAFVSGLKSRSGLAIWLCGGADLATTLFEAGLIDRLVLKVNPVVFGAGIPLFRTSMVGHVLTLESHEAFESGHLLLEYAVTAAPPPEVAEVR